MLHYALYSVTLEVQKLASVDNILSIPDNISQIPVSLSVVQLPAFNDSWSIVVVFLGLSMKTTHVTL